MIIIYICIYIYIHIMIIYDYMIIHDIYIYVILYHISTHHRIPGLITRSHLGEVPTHQGSARGSPASCHQGPAGSPKSYDFVVKNRNLAMFTMVYQWFCQWVINVLSMIYQIAIVKKIHELSMFIIIVTWSFGVASTPLLRGKKKRIGRLDIVEITKIHQPFFSMNELRHAAAWSDVYSQQQTTHGQTTWK